MIPHYLIIGNLLSFCCAVCIAVSVVKRNKQNLIWWQIWDSIFGLLASLVLFSYSSFTTGLLCVTRNLLAYNKRLTKLITLALVVTCIVVGLYANNRGFWGLLPIIAFTWYTLTMYCAKNDQQMRYSLIINLSIWLFHDFYIQAYPSAIMDITVSIWTFYQAMRRIHRKRRLKKITSFKQHKATRKLHTKPHH